MPLPLSGGQAGGPGTAPRRIIVIVSKTPVLAREPVVAEADDVDEVHVDRLARCWHALSSAPDGVPVALVRAITCVAARQSVLRRDLQVGERGEAHPADRPTPPAWVRPAAPRGSTKSSASRRRSRRRPGVPLDRGDRGRVTSGPQDWWSPSPYEAESDCRMQRQHFASAVLDQNADDHEQVCRPPR